MSLFVGKEFLVLATMFGKEWAIEEFGDPQCNVTFIRCRITKYFPSRKTKPRKRKPEVVPECWAYKVIKDGEETGYEFNLHQGTFCC